MIQAEEMTDLYRENYKTLIKKLKKTQINGRYPVFLDLED